jgi:hypothetical protein
MIAREQQGVARGDHAKVGSHQMERLETGIPPSCVTPFGRPLAAREGRPLK